MDGVHGISGGQELAGGGTGSIIKVQHDLGAGTGNAVDPAVAHSAGLTIFHGNIRNQDAVGIDLVDSDPGDRLSHSNHTLVNGKGTNAGGNIAAVAAIVHQLSVKTDLSEGVIHIGVWTA